MSEIDETGNREIKTIVFDMDNTLFDFIEAKLAACNAMTEHLGTEDAQDLFMYFLRGIYDFEDWNNISDYMKDRNIYSQIAFDDCCRIYEDIKIQTIELYPHVKQTLQNLNEMGFPLAVLTDAHADHATARLEKLEIIDHFDIVITTDMTQAKKPAPEVFNYALDALQRMPHQVLYVGDSLHRDIGPAKKVGMSTAYAVYGDRNYLEERVSEADHVLESIRDVVRAVGVE